MLINIICIKIQIIHIIGYTEELFTGQINNYVFNIQIIVNIGRY
jgi:hypothetical protein